MQGDGGIGKVRGDIEIFDADVQNGLMGGGKGFHPPFHRKRSAVDQAGKGGPDENISVIGQIGKERDAQFDVGDFIPGLFEVVLKVDFPPDNLDIVDGETKERPLLSSCFEQVREVIGSVR
jgi:hypothetical protein